MNNEYFDILQKLFEKFKNSNKFLTKCNLFKIIIFEGEVILLDFEHLYEYSFEFEYEFDEDEETDLIRNIIFQIELIMKAYYKELKQYLFTTEKLTENNNTLIIKFDKSETNFKILKYNER